MNFPRVTIQIVIWNSLKFLPDCLTSIFSQTYRDFQILVIDNESQDGAVKFLKANYPEVTVFQNNKNLGFAKAHNQGIKLLNSPYILVCNPDIILEPDWLEIIMNKADAPASTQRGEPANEKFGTLGGKVLKMKIINKEINDIEKTDIIDSCGLKIFKSHRVVELGAGELSDKFINKQEVFGHSGALVLYNRRALEDCLVKTQDRPQGEYFDEDFFCYKEDVDLAWRLQLNGWKSLLVPEATAYHVRTMAGSERKGMWKIMENKKNQSNFAKYYSYRNHFFVLIKNEFKANLIKYLPQIFWYELKKFIYTLIFEWSNLRVWGDIFILMPKMLRKRKLILNRAKANFNYIRKWIN
ncbi:glycosyltransferase family 2 protein [Candidatus Falkowbacteria bacterium]|nr:glycosyltransferase family 2 protein [Candidatus Falkowbacteria bacterium]